MLGETKLEGAVTTDICGKRDSHATRLDAEATETIKNARLHRKAITAIFFESNGGQAKADATVPEIRFTVAEPGLDIGNVETALEALTEGCYYLAVERNRYHFSLKENLNKRFADRRATIPPTQVEEHIRGEIQKVFAAGAGVERVYFAESFAVQKRSKTHLPNHRDQRMLRSAPGLRGLRSGSVRFSSHPLVPIGEGRRCARFPLEVGSAAPLLPSFLHMLHFGNARLSIAHFQPK